LEDHGSAFGRHNSLRGAIERAGTTLPYLPAYSPDFNPIDQAFANLESSAPKGRGANVRSTHQQ
jgi:transposase